MASSDDDDDFVMEVWDEGEHSGVFPLFGADGSAAAAAAAAALHSAPSSSSSSSNRIRGGGGGGGGAGPDAFRQPPRAVTSTWRSQPAAEKVLSGGASGVSHMLMDSMDDKSLVAWSQINRNNNTIVRDRARRDPAFRARYTEAIRPKPEDFTAEYVRIAQAEQVLREAKQANNTRVADTFSKYVSFLENQEWGGDSTPFSVVLRAYRDGNASVDYFNETADPRDGPPLPRVLPAGMFELMSHYDSATRNHWLN